MIRILEARRESSPNLGCNLGESQKWHYQHGFFTTRYIRLQWLGNNGSSASFDLITRQDGHRRFFSLSLNWRISAMYPSFFFSSSFFSSLFWSFFPIVLLIIPLMILVIIVLIILPIVLLIIPLMILVIIVLIILPIVLLIIPLMILVIIVLIILPIVLLIILLMILVIIRIIIHHFFVCGGGGVTCNNLPAKNWGSMAISIYQ